MADRYARPDWFLSLESRPYRTNQPFDWPYPRLPTHDLWNQTPVLDPAPSTPAASSGGILGNLAPSSAGLLGSVLPPIDGSILQSPALTAALPSVAAGGRGNPNNLVWPQTAPSFNAVASEVPIPGSASRQPAPFDRHGPRAVVEKASPLAYSNNTYLMRCKALLI
jgi:hypothetical protein